MKKLIIINGTMGVGKTTVCRLLLHKLTPGVFLDGDWCWYMNPFIVSAENKNMVLDNISYLLKNYLANSGYRYILFCWVIPQEEIFSQLLAPLDGLDFELTKITLLCSEAALTKRLRADISQGLRTPDIIDKSIARLPLYADMNTIKLDTTAKAPVEIAEQIFRLLKNH